jgi:hypothetical protein
MRFAAHQLQVDTVQSNHAGKDLANVIQFQDRVG